MVDRTKALDQVAESQVVQQVWANPIPSAMVGIGVAGLAWLAFKAQQTSRRPQTQLQRAMKENPLFVGAAALAAGAMIGMAVPETEQENEWMGATRDNVVAEAQQVARNAATRVQEAATDAVKRVQNVVTDPVKLLSQDD